MRLNDQKGFKKMSDDFRNSENTPYAHVEVWLTLFPDEHTSTHGHRKSDGLQRQGRVGNG